MSRNSDPQREKLQADANLLRSRLADNLEFLDHRLHDVFSNQLQVVKQRVSSTLIGAGVMIVVGSGALLLLGRIRTRRSRRLTEGVRALKRIWQHPEYLAQKKRSPLAKEIARGMAINLATWAGTELGRRFLMDLLPAPGQRQARSPLP